MHKRELSLILPNIRSCHNVGAMFRTADACGVAKLYLCGYTAEPPKVQIDKVSLGAEKWIPWERADDLPTLLHRLKKKGVRVVGLELTEESKEIGDWEPNTGQNVALLVGNEVDGISEDVLLLCDDVVHIPMYGKKESFNVSIAAGIAMYLFRQKLNG